MKLNIIYTTKQQLLRYEKTLVNFVVIGQVWSKILLFDQLPKTTTSWISMTRTHYGRLRLATIFSSNWNAGCVIHVDITWKHYGMITQDKNTNFLKQNIKNAEITLTRCQKHTIASTKYQMHSVSHIMGMEKHDNNQKLNSIYHPGKQYL